MRLVLLSLVALGLGGGAAAGSSLPTAPRCAIFPASNPWNQRVDTLPAAPDSAAIVASIGADTGLHADFGSGLWNGGPIGIPITVVRGSQAPSRVTFGYASESDKGPYPIPANVAIEGGPAASADVQPAGLSRFERRFQIAPEPARQPAAVRSSAKSS